MGAEFLDRCINLLKSHTPLTRIYCFQDRFIETPIALKVRKISKPFSISGFLLRNEFKVRLSLESMWDLR